jgi:hypothetical protein
VSLPPCPACGAPVGGAEGCARAFEELGLRRYSDVRYARWNRLMVDAYSLQHPALYMKSAKSFAAHLTGAAAALERPGQSEFINEAVVRWLSTNPVLVRPSEPPDGARGDITVADVLRAEDPAAAIPAWAESAWRAWSGLHALARQWIAVATHDRAAVR